MFQKLLIILALSFFGELNAQMKVFDTFDEFEEQIIDLREDSVLYVINFWATWCKPCVKELPYFEEVNLANESAQVILVSLDFKHQVKTKLIPFIEQIGYTSEFILLNDSNYNDWIDKVDPQWSGAIPATVFYYKDQKIFKEKQYHSKDELQQEIDNILKQ